MHFNFSADCYQVMNINYSEPTIVNSLVNRFMCFMLSFMQKVILRLNLIVKQYWVFIALKAQGKRDNRGPSENAGFWFRVRFSCDWWRTENVGDFSFFSKRVRHLFATTIMHKCLKPHLLYRVKISRVEMTLCKSMHSFFKILFSGKFEKNCRL